MRPLVVAAFTNEEGVRFQPDMMGSLVHAGGLALQQALDVQSVHVLALDMQHGTLSYSDGANMPIEFLLSGSDVELTTLFGFRL